MNSDHTFDDGHAEHGRILERRSVLALAGASAALLATRGHAQSATPPSAVALATGTPLSFAEFLALANPLAKALAADVSPMGQDRYLHAIAALAVRMSAVPVPEMRAQKTPGTFLGANEGGETFNVLHWRMEPNSVIHDHPHIYGNVVTLVLDGEIVVRNHEVLGQRDWDAKGTFQVRRTCEQIVRPGGINLVSLERNYTHGFRTGAIGARGLDITTKLLPRRDSPVLELGSKPVDEARGIYEASWAY